MANAQNLSADGQHKHLQSAVISTAASGVINTASISNMDCCSEGTHVNCTAFTPINIPANWHQEIANNFSLSMPIIEAYYTSFIFKIPTPPPAV